MEGDDRKRNRSRKRRRSKTKTDSFSNQIQTIQSTHISPDNDRDKAAATAAPPAKQRHFKCRNPKAPAISKSSSFLEKMGNLMKARLSGFHFRMINEKLYTCTRDEALGYFKDDPSLFDMYHAGYQEQMSHWPELPLVVADFDCGDARVAKSVKNKVFSIDLVSNEPSVIACDMANAPLDSSSVDVAVFCLSLMGINFPSYLQEAHRVLKPRCPSFLGHCVNLKHLKLHLQLKSFDIFVFSSCVTGWLLIPEVKSRFDPNTGGADPNDSQKLFVNWGLTQFHRISRTKCSFFCISRKRHFSHLGIQVRMPVLFVEVPLVKVNSIQEEIKWPELKPRLYKRR